MHPRDFGPMALLAGSLFVLMAMTRAATAQEELWLPSLITATPQDGFELALTLSRKAVTSTQPDKETLHAIRPFYSEDGESLIQVSQTVALWFSVVAEANSHWKPVD